MTVYPSPYLYRESLTHMAIVEGALLQVDHLVYQCLRQEDKCIQEEPQVWDLTSLVCLLVLSLFQHQVHQDSHPQ
jgi:hypothetical protein